MKKIVIIFLLVILAGCMNTSPEAVDVMLENLQGEQSSLGEVLGEKGTVLYFSGSWVDTNGAFEYLNEMEEEYKRNGINTYFVGQVENNEKVEDFLKRNQVVLDYYADIDKKLFEIYDITFLPTIVFIDSYQGTEAILTKEIEPYDIDSVVNNWLESNSIED